jgi:hypothetical protein
MAFSQLKVDHWNFFKNAGQQSHNNKKIRHCLDRRQVEQSYIKNVQSTKSELAITYACQTKSGIRTVCFKPTKYAAAQHRDLKNERKIRTHNRNTKVLTRRLWRWPQHQSEICNILSMSNLVGWRKRPPSKQRESGKDGQMDRHVWSSATDIWASPFRLMRRPQYAL